MRRVAPILAAAVLGAASSVALGDDHATRTDASAAAAPTVRVGDNYFSPRRLTVRRGTRVRFVWVGRKRHNVTGGGRASRSVRRKGYVYRRTFRRSTSLVCTIHPEDMRMRIRVR